MLAVDGDSLEVVLKGHKDVRTLRACATMSHVLARLGLSRKKEPDRHRARLPVVVTRNAAPFNVTIL